MSDHKVSSLWITISIDLQQQSQNKTQQSHKNMKRQRETNDRQRDTKHFKPNGDYQIYYIYSERYVTSGSLLPSNTMHKLEDLGDNTNNNRSLMVHSLLQSFDLHLLPNVHVVEPEEATLQDLQSFHSMDYLKALQAIDRKITCKNSVNSCIDGENVISDEEFEHLKITYGFVQDAEPFPGIFQYCKSIAGGSIACAKILNSNGKCSSDNRELESDEDGKDMESKQPIIAIAWEGGRHHCFRSKAAGFCFVNDVVLTVLQLLKHHKRILCIDTDIHHHDAVQSAFYHSDRVLTLSFHEYGQGFYPGTGNVNECGMENTSGMYYNCNVPFKEGIIDVQYFQLFRPIVRRCIDIFQPDCIVWVCGADLLSGDMLGHANLSLHLVEKLALYLKAFIIDSKYPNLRKMCVLGGGGYDNCKTSICWASITALLAGVKLSNEIPEHPYYGLYKCTNFERVVNAKKLMPNYNSASTLKTTLNQVIENLDKLSERISHNSK